MISCDFLSRSIALRARSRLSCFYIAFSHETKSLGFATFIRNQLQIPEVTFYIRIKSGYDPRDDVMYSYKVRV